MLFFRANILRNGSKILRSVPQKFCKRKSRYVEIIFCKILYYVYYLYFVNMATNWCVQFIINYLYIARVNPILPWIPVNSGPKLYQSTYINISTLKLDRIYTPRGNIYYKLPEKLTGYFRFDIFINQTEYNFFKGLKRLCTMCTTWIRAPHTPPQPS